ncbi:TPA: hypothetical protein N7L20_003915 [Escherichia coli]|nr:hypothetical protein [Escherichia coli]
MVQLADLARCVSF